jgi:hypothetical protein
MTEEEMRGFHYTLPWAGIVGLFAVIVGGCASPERAGEDGAASEPLSQEWRTPTHLTLVFKHGRDVTRWRYTFGSDGVIHLKADDGAAGEMLLVNGQVLLLRNLSVPAGSELEVFDDAMLKQQAALGLLQQAVRRGPETIKGTQKIDARDRGQPIGAETTNSSLYFYPPWDVRGSLERIAEERLAFRLKFEFSENSPGGKGATAELSGEWRRDKAAPKFGDEFPLEGWEFYRIQMGTRNSGGITVAGYVTRHEAKRYANLGELRAALREHR